MLKKYLRIIVIASAVECCHHYIFGFSTEESTKERASGVHVHHFVNICSVFCIIPVKHFMNLNIQVTYFN